jgi:hypothetical protein
LRVLGGVNFRGSVDFELNRVDERRNMINDYLRGRACIESVRGSVDFELFCAF